MKGQLMPAAFSNAALQALKRWLDVGVVVASKALGARQVRKNHRKRTSVHPIEMKPKSCSPAKLLSPRE